MSDTLTKLKPCNRCKEYKDAEEGFYKHPLGKYGRADVCKDCRYELDTEKKRRAKEELVIGYTADAPFDWIWDVK